MGSRAVKFGGVGGIADLTVSGLISIPKLSFDGNDIISLQIPLKSVQFESSDFEHIWKLSRKYCVSKYNLYGAKLLVFIKGNRINNNNRVVIDCSIKWHKMIMRSAEAKRLYVPDDEIFGLSAVSQ